MGNMVGAGAGVGARAGAAQKLTGSATLDILSITYKSK
jgi:hypothetical protein